MAFTQVTVTHDFVVPSAAGALGTVEFDPVAPMHNAAKTVVGPRRAVLAVDGTISIQLDATTDPGTWPTGVRYRVAERITGLPSRIYYVSVPHNQGATLDLDALIASAGPSSGTVAISGVTGLQAALDAKAADTATVHTTGAETVAGVKTFSSPPIVPTPTTSGQAAPKGYVDGVAVGGGIPATIVDAKGDLIVGTGADTVARFPVGTNGSVPQAASGQTTGLSWTPMFQVHSVGNSGTTLTLDASSTSGNIKLVTLTGNCTVTLAGAATGLVTTMELVLTQDATGSRTLTFSGSTPVKWDSGTQPSLSSAANAIDRILLTNYGDGRGWFGDLVGKSYV